jgi:hypothetical protein
VSITQRLRSDHAAINELEEKGREEIELKRVEERMNQSIASRTYVPFRNNVGEADHH